MAPFREEPQRLLELPFLTAYSLPRANSIQRAWTLLHIILRLGMGGTAREDVLVMGMLPAACGD